ncbi:hypothetical protein [Streptomyces canus]|uniref:hypothetical protein n=1 Tax=Streptomyces canus TaxID=58343 RepID=UPI00277FF842|nr:hypothetical protein [Streptomyces canus]MDQ0765597.1 hypothetical protein [Streptomyces canus]
MIPLLTTRHTWQIQSGETPLPPTLPSDFDVVRVSMGLGMASIDTMLDASREVGPLLCCITHRVLLVPVESGTADRWLPPLSACSSGPSFQCLTRGYQPPCRARFWLSVPEPTAAAVTEPAGLHESLSQTRARMRRVCGTRGREVCHA